MSDFPEKPITVALAGNPNCGKTAVFNLLTGSKQRVGNWPGVTVEQKTGRYHYQQQAVDVVDLPGVYSLSATDQETSIDEQIACGYLVSGVADCIVNVLDGAHLERNLYLTLQLLEMKIPVILVVNMMDLVVQRGLVLDLKKIEKTLGCKVVPMTASRGIGVDDLKKTIVQVAKNPTVSDWSLPLSPLLEKAMLCVKQAILYQTGPQIYQRANWLALGLLAGDTLAQKQVGQSVVLTVQQQLQQLTQTLPEDPDILIADARYGFIGDFVARITTLQQTSRRSITQWLDRIVLNRYLGIPIFLLMMYFMFLFAINVGGAFQDFFDIASTTLFVEGLAHGLLALHFPPWIVAILASGVGKGVNTVVTFIPIIGAMFFFLSFLEDSGYMARAAFVVDRCMRALGLPGKSFVPMIVGFGCNVPAIMGARTLSNPRDRILTVLMMPFMSCGARLAIFSVFASAFFPVGGQNVIFILYITGILVAVLTGVILRKTILTGKPAPLVMELPPYHVPRFHVLALHAWSRLKRFLFRAGKVIVPVCILIGALNAISVNGVLVGQNSKQPSVLSVIGETVTPLLAPIGIKKDNWPATVGLATGVLAKEVVVGTLNTLYSQVGHLTHQEAAHFQLWQGLKSAVMSIPQNLAGLKDALKNPFLAAEAPVDMDHAVFGVMYRYFDGKAGAFAYLLFVLLYFPCVATMAAMQRELSRGWAVFSVGWSTVLAYGLATIVFQALTIQRHPLNSIEWIGAMLGMLISVVLGLRFWAYDFTRRQTVSERKSNV